MIGYTRPTEIGLPDLQTTRPCTIHKAKATMAYRETPTPRHHLAYRRLSETTTIQTSCGQTVHLSIGFDPSDPKRPREVFYSAGFRSGSQLEFQTQDACVLISLLLQHGLAPNDIAKSLSRLEQPDGTMAYASITGIIADEIVTAAESS